MTNVSLPRRRFQFRLRTLMIVVTLFCVIIGGYIGWQKKIVLNRQQERKWIESRGAVLSSNVRYPGKVPYRPSVSWVRGMLGDSAVAIIKVPKPLGNDDEQRLRAAFAEAVEISIGTPIYPPSTPAPPATKP